MTIYTNNLKAMEVLLTPNLWKFADIEQLSPTKAKVICKTSAAAGMDFTRATITFRPTEDNKMVVSLSCKFLNAKFKEQCNDCGCDMTITNALRSLLAKQEASYYGETPEYWLMANLDPDEPEVHG